MARNVTLTVLRRQSRELADQEASGANAFVDDTELDGMINASLGRWHDLIIKAVPERFEAEQTVTADGSIGYDLPSDYRATIKVEYEQSSDQRIDLPRAMLQERNRWSRTGDDARAYYLSGSQLVLVPAPSEGTYYHTYVTAAPVLASGSETIDGVNGWEQWIVYDVASKMLAKEEGLDSAAYFVAERNAIQREIESAAAEREMMNPQRVVDVRTAPFRYNTPGYRDPDFWYGR